MNPWPVCPSCEHHARVYSDATNTEHRCGDCGHQWYERPPAGSDAARYGPPSMACPACTSRDTRANGVERECNACGARWFRTLPTADVVRPTLVYHLWSVRVSAGHDEARAVHAVARQAEAMAQMFQSREDVACCLLGVAVAMLARDHDELEVAHALAVALDLECRDKAHQRARETAAACLAAVMEVGR